MKRDGKKSEAVVVGCRVPTAVAEQLRTAASKNDRTVSGELRRLLRNWAAEQAPAGR